MKLSYVKFSCRKLFVGTTLYHVNVNSAHDIVFFVRLISVATIDYETVKISRFAVHH